jgi:glycerate 2-kinase
MTRRVVIAPDSFKGTISAADAAAALAEGWRSVAPDDVLIERPMADGGEGTLDAIARARPDARRMPLRATGPDDRAVDAHWLLLTEADGSLTGVVELAATSGLTLLDTPLPVDAHTVGLGEAMLAALDAKVGRLVIALGGSASTDGGAGALAALGARLLDSAGRPVARGLRGLSALDHVPVDALRRPPAGGAVILADVDAPLLGPRGAAAVFGPQKGLDSAHHLAADAALAHWGRALCAALGHDADALAASPGAGAAGGTAFGLLAWGATLSPGAAAIADLLALPAAIADADLVITGEGRFDAQSAGGKAPALVAALAAAAGVPCTLVAGEISEIGEIGAIGATEPADARAGAFASMLALSALAGSREAALAEPARWLRVAGAALAEQFTLPTVVEE